MSRGQCTLCKPRFSRIAPTCARSTHAALPAAPRPPESSDGPAEPGPGECTPGVVEFYGGLFWDLAHDRRTSLAQIMLDNNLTHHSVVTNGSLLNVTCPPGLWSELFGLWDYPDTWGGKLPIAQVRAPWGEPCETSMCEAHVSLVRRWQALGTKLACKALPPQCGCSSQAVSAHRRSVLATGHAGPELPARIIHRRATHTALWNTNDVRSTDLGLRMGRHDCSHL